MKSNLTEKTITTFLVVLILMLNFQYYFAVNRSDFSTPQKQYTKATHNNFDNDFSVANILNEDEASETDLSLDSFSTNFCYNNFNTCSSLKLLTSALSTISINTIITKPIYILIRHLLI